MDLPVWIVGSELPPELAAGPVISVDGAASAPGLNLSHWPGNRTPRALRHDLSTGSALLFGRLAPAERARLAAGARAICNNHYDTDGACALFAVRHPAAALARAEPLLNAARAGDLFRIPDEPSLALDAIVAGLPDPARSPLGGELGGLGDRARHQRATDHLMEHLGALLDGDRAPYRALYEPVLERARADLADLAAAARDDLVHLDWTLWTAKAGAAPGRHALFGSTDADRVLVVVPADGGALFRLVISTLSWFDLPSRDPLPRPDLEALAARLNGLEGRDPAGELAWRAQPAAGPSPELWFGRAELQNFSEHNPALTPSALEPGRVRRVVAEALRAVAALP